MEIPKTNSEKVLVCNSALAYYCSGGFYSAYDVAETPEDKETITKYKELIKALSECLVDAMLEYMPDLAQGGTEMDTAGGWRTICIFEEGNDEMPFRGIEEVPREATAEEVLENWISSIYGEDFETGVITRDDLSDYKYFYVHPLFGTRFRTAEAPFGGTDSCAYAISNYQLNLCRMFEVPATFFISDERFFLLQREFSDQHVVMKAAEKEE